MRRPWVVPVGTAAVLLAACASGPAGSDSSAPASSQPSTSGSVAACPATAQPDRPGDPTQARPALRDPFLLAALDPTRPRIVVGETGLVPEGAGRSTLQSTWGFDVCTNAWTEVGEASLPAPQDRPALGQFVSDAGAGVVLGLPFGLTPVWSFDPSGDAWSEAASTGGGSEAWPLVVYDPDSGRLLAFDPNALGASGASGVAAYDRQSRAWTDVELADSAAEVPGVRMAQYDVAYDSAARRLILVITPEGASDDPAETWAFDPAARTWTRGQDVPRSLPQGYPTAGWAMAFDPESGRTWLFADTAMLGYDAQAEAWTAADRDAGWPSSMMLGDVEVDPMARIVSTMVLDRVNGRLVVVAGRVRPVGDPAGGSTSEASLLATDDVWAFQPDTNTWTMLLAPSDAPASYGPG